MRTHRFTSWKIDTTCWIGGRNTVSPTVQTHTHTRTPSHEMRESGTHAHPDTRHTHIHTHVWWYPTFMPCSRRTFVNQPLCHGRVVTKRTRRAPCFAHTDSGRVVAEQEQTGKKKRSGRGGMMARACKRRASGAPLLIQPSSIDSELMYL